MKRPEAKVLSKPPEGAIPFEPGEAADTAIEKFRRGIEKSITSAQNALVAPNPNIPTPEACITANLIKMDNLTEGTQTYYVRTWGHMGPVSYPSSDHLVVGITADCELLICLMPGQEIYVTPQMMFDHRRQVVDHISQSLKSQGFGGDMSKVFESVENMQKFFGDHSPEPDEGEDWKPPGWRPGDPE